MSYADEVRADHAITFWALNEVSGTVAASTPTATFVDTVRAGTYVGGPTLGGAGLVGTNHAVATTSSSYVNLPTPIDALGNSITIEFWFAYVSGSAPLWSDNQSTGTWFFDISGTHPVVCATGASHTFTSVASSSLKDGARHHVVITSAGSRLRLYLDGVLIEEWATPVLLQQLSYTSNLGKDNGSNYSPGVFAAFAFYRTTLSAERVAAHYAAADGHVAGVATIAVAARPAALTHPGTAGVTVTALPVALSAPVETRAPLRLVSSSITQVDAPPDAPDPRAVPIHIVSPSTPVPTLVNGVPQ